MYEAIGDNFLQLSSGYRQFGYQVLTFLGIKPWLKTPFLYSITVTSVRPAVGPKGHGWLIETTTPVDREYEADKLQLVLDAVNQFHEDGGNPIDAVMLFDPLKVAEPTDLVFGHIGSSTWGEELTRCFYNNRYRMTTVPVSRHVMGHLRPTNLSGITLMEGGAGCYCLFIEGEDLFKGGFNRMDVQLALTRFSLGKTKHISPYRGYHAVRNILESPARLAGLAAPVVPVRRVRRIDQYPAAPA